MTFKPRVDPHLLPTFESMSPMYLEAAMLADPGRLTPMRVSLLNMQAEAAPPLPLNIEKSEVVIAGPQGAPPVRVVLYQPRSKSPDRSAILHIHGGGYVFGAPELSEPVLASYAGQIGAVVASVDYRLAPETRFPGAIEDCYAALTWLYAQAEALGIDISRIAISGESAGGGLAAALALLARDRGEFRIAFQHLIFPMIDDRTAAAANGPAFLGEYLWTRQDNAIGWAALLGAPPGGADVSPYAAAARAKTLAGLPPTFIACGALDLFVEEDIEYARRLICEGTPTELHIYPGAPHGFHMLAPQAPVSHALLRDSMGALKRALQKDF